MNVLDPCTGGPDPLIYNSGHSVCSVEGERAARIISVNCDEITKRLLPQAKKRIHLIYVPPGSWRPTAAEGLRTTLMRGADALRRGMCGFSWWVVEIKVYRQEGALDPTVEVLFDERQAWKSQVRGHAGHLGTPSRDELAENALASATSGVGK